MKRRSSSTAPHPVAPQKSPKGTTHWIWGRHAVEAALRNPRRRMDELVTTSALPSMALPPVPPSLTTRLLEPQALKQLLGPDAIHQGIAARVHPLPDVSWQDAPASEGPVCWIMLDQVTDPHNVGAIVRSAAVFGITGVILPRHHAPQESGTMAKAASGALENVPLCYETNLSRTLEAMKKEGFWVVGLAEEGSEGLVGFQWPEKTVLVMGSEDKGLRPLVQENCDYVVTIPSAYAFSTLNVSTATAICCYAWAQHGKA